jgi:hypothetical protein
MTRIRRIILEVILDQPPKRGSKFRNDFQAVLGKNLLVIDLHDGILAVTAAIGIEANRVIVAGRKPSAMEIACRHERFLQVRVPPDRMHELEISIGASVRAHEQGTDFKLHESIPPYERPKGRRQRLEQLALEFIDPWSVRKRLDAPGIQRWVARIFLRTQESWYFFRASRLESSALIQLFDEPVNQLVRLQPAAQQSSPVVVSDQRSSALINGKVLVLLSQRAKELPHALYPAVDLARRSRV